MCYQMNLVPHIDVNKIAVDVTEGFWIEVLLCFLNYICCFMFLNLGNVFLFKQMKKLGKKN